MVVSWLHLEYYMHRRQGTKRVSLHIAFLCSQDKALRVLKVVTTNQRGLQSSYSNRCKFDCCVGLAVIVVMVRYPAAWHQQHAMHRDYRRNGEGLEHGCRCDPAALLLLYSFILNFWLRG